MQCQLLRRRSGTAAEVKDAELGADGPIPVRTAFVTPSSGFGLDPERRLVCLVEQRDDVLPRLLVELEVDAVDLDLGWSKPVSRLAAEAPSRISDSVRPSVLRRKAAGRRAHCSSSSHGSAVAR